MAKQAGYKFTITGGTSGAIASTRNIVHSSASAADVDFSVLSTLIKNIGKGTIDPGSLTFQALIGTNAGYDTALVSTAIGGSGATGTILDIRSVSFAGAKRATVDVTTLKSADRYREKLPGRVDMGEITVGWFSNIGAGDPSKHKSAIDRLSTITLPETWTFTLPDATTLIVPARIKGAKFFDVQDGDTGVSGELVLRSSATWTGTVITGNLFYAGLVADPGVVETWTIAGPSGTGSIAIDGFVSGWKPMVSDVDQAITQEIEVTLTGKPTVTLGS